MDDQVITYFGGTKDLTTEDIQKFRKNGLNFFINTTGRLPHKPRNFV
jgi:hypothetical protein